MIQEHKNKVSDEKILEYYESNKTLGETASLLNMKPLSLWRRATNLGIKWSDKKIKRPYNKIPIEDILEGKHPEYQTFKLKKRLLKEGIKENICEECGIKDWNSKELEMQLEHIDGNPHNHLLNNLKMICPNCHSQTKTWCGKNKGS